MENKRLTNRFTKTFISSLLIIVLALSMIGGATYALFTSTSSVNVAINSATVQVVATPKNVVLYSPKLINMNGTIADATNIATDNTFANGGTATFSGNTLTLDRIAPGDKVTFDIDFGNQSNIKIKYRLKIEGKGQDSITESGETKTNDTLLSGLTTTISETGNAPVVYDKLRTYVSAWKELDPAEAETAVSSLNVSVELPAEKGDAYQNLECSFKYSIEAVQFNTSTVDYVEQFGGIQGDAFVEKLAYVYTGQELTDAVAAMDAGQGQTLVFGGHIQTPYLMPNTAIFKAKNLTLDLNSFSLTLDNEHAVCLSTMMGNASLSIKNGTIIVRKTESSSSLFDFGNERNIYDKVVEQSLTLENITLDYTSDVLKEYDNRYATGIGCIINSRAQDYNTKVNVTVKNSTFDIKGPMNTAVYLPNNGTRVFENVTIKGDRVATSLMICAGDWTVTGGSYVGNKCEFGYGAGDNPVNLQQSLFLNNHSIWEGEFIIKAGEFSNSQRFPDGLLTTGISLSFGTGDAICIVNKYAVEAYGKASGKVLSILGKISIENVNLKMGTVSLLDQSTVKNEDIISGPSGYGVRVYDVKAEGHPVLKISGITVDNKTQTKKSGATVTLPDIYYVSAENPANTQERTYRSFNGSISETPISTTTGIVRKVY